jgi:hypothetical protein
MHVATDRDGRLPGKALGQHTIGAQQPLGWQEQG